jgi:calcium/calmodulin-dependent protein kinase I
MQAILEADYSFTPEEYWRGVSNTARDFIRVCLTVDPSKRQTAHDALGHPWIKEETSAAKSPDGTAGAGGPDLLPTVKKNFNARVKLHAAIDTIRAINQLRAGQGAAKMMMDGAKSKEPVKGAPALAAIAMLAKPGIETGSEMEGVEGTGQLGHDEMDVDSTPRLR